MSCAKSSATSGVAERCYGADFSYGAGCEASRVRTGVHRQAGLDRQVAALADAGIEKRHIYMDKKSGATTDAPAFGSYWSTPGLATS